eukprot:g7002.t1
MKTKKGKKNSSGTAVASAGATDTARWEQLLAGGRGAAAAAPATITAAMNARPAGRNKPAGTVAPRSDEPPTKPKALGNTYASVTNNWEHLLTKGAAATGAGAAAATAAAASKGSKRPRSKIGQAGGTTSATAITTPNFFSVKWAGNGVKPQTATATPAAGQGGNSKAGGTKRKRATNSVADGGANANGFPPGIHSKQQKQHQHQHQHAGVANKKRPRSNVLNLAFQAQKEEAAAAAANGAGGNAAKHVGRDKGRGSKAGGRGGSEQALTAAEKAQYVALDCEMVGVGPGGCRSALARCCLVDWEGNTIYDKHVTPNERVTDFRTFVSGVKANHLKGGLRLRQCQEEVAAILKGRVLVGHALHNDLKALMMSHPPRATRDTAAYRPYQKAHGKAGGKLRPKSLKILSQEHLNRTIQSGQHNPAEDARAAMDLYKLARFEWEKSLSAAGKMRGRRAVVDQQGR